MRQNRIKILCAEHNIPVAQLAQRIGMQPAALRRYTRQEAQPKLELAQLIAETLSVSVDDVLGVKIGTESTQVPARQLPLYGAVQGGIGHEITDVTDPIDSIDTPSWLASVPDSYAVFVTGNSMEPRFRAREIIYVHPYRPYREGDYVVVQLQANGRVHAIVKQFVEMTDDEVILKQHNPAKELRHARSEVAAIHLVVGSYFA